MTTMIKTASLALLSLAAAGALAGCNTPIETDYDAPPEAAAAHAAPAKDTPKPAKR